MPWRAGYCEFKKNQKGSSQYQNIENRGRIIHRKPLKNDLTGTKLLLARILFNSGNRLGQEYVTCMSTFQPATPCRLFCEEHSADLSRIPFQCVRTTAPERGRTFLYICCIFVHSNLGAIEEKSSVLQGFQFRFIMPGNLPAIIITMSRRVSRRIRP